MRPSWILLLVAVLVAAGCDTSQPEADVSTPDATGDDEAGGTAATEQVESTLPFEARDVAEREVWRPVGIVIPSTDYADYGGFSDVKVGRFGDGTYLGTVASSVGSYLVFTSTDLRDWEYLHEFAFTDGPDAFRLPGAMLTTDDGGLRKFWVSDEPPGPQGHGIASATSTDGITWVRDQGWRLVEADFDDDVLFQFLTIVERPQGGWRMYVQALDCDKEDLFGEPNCELGEGEDHGCHCKLASIYSAVSDDMLEWNLEPGVRFEGSLESGVLHQPNAWVHDDGTVRIASQMEIAPHAPGERWDFQRAIHLLYFGTIVSQDGLQFGPVETQRVRADDPYTIRDPDGELVMLTLDGGIASLGEFDGLRLWDRATVAWEFDELLLLETWAEVEGWDLEAGVSATQCLLLAVHGQGRFDLEVRGNLHPHAVDSSDPDLYRIPATIEAPGAERVYTRFRHDTSWEAGELPYHVVATDEQGVVEWLQISPVPDRLADADCS